MEPQCPLVLLMWKEMKSSPSMPGQCASLTLTSSRSKPSWKSLHLEMETSIWACLQVTSAWIMSSSPDKQTHTHEVLLTNIIIHAKCDAVNTFFPSNNINCKVYWTHLKLENITSVVTTEWVVKSQLFVNIVVSFTTYWDWIKTEALTSSGGG